MDPYPDLIRWENDPRHSFDSHHRAPKQTWNQNDTLALYQGLNPQRYLRDQQTIHKSLPPKAALQGLNYKHTTDIITSETGTLSHYHVTDAADTDIINQGSPNLKKAINKMKTLLEQSQQKFIDFASAETVDAKPCQNFTQIKGMVHALGLFNKFSDLIQKLIVIIREQIVGWKGNAIIRDATANLCLIFDAEKQTMNYLQQIMRMCTAEKTSFEIQRDILGKFKRALPLFEQPREVRRKNEAKQDIQELQRTKPHGFYSRRNKNKKSNKRKRSTNNHPKRKRQRASKRHRKRTKKPQDFIA